MPPRFSSNVGGSGQGSVFPLHQLLQSLPPSSHGLLLWVSSVSLCLNLPLLSLLKIPVLGFGAHLDLV